LCRADDLDTLRELIDLLSEVTGERDSLTIADAAALFGVSPAEFASKWLRMKDGSILPEPTDGLKVLPRCRHIFSEAARVAAAAQCMRKGDMEAVGRLMNKSHQSCASNYEISTAELDQLTEIMREGGALGARLTGAGFGGYAIALVRSGRVALVRRALDAGFYRPRGLTAKDHVLAFTPAAGARVEAL
jgi:galactokinase